MGLQLVRFQADQPPPSLGVMQAKFSPSEEVDVQYEHDGHWIASNTITLDVQYEHDGHWIASNTITLGSKREQILCLFILASNRLVYRFGTMVSTTLILLLE